MHILALILLAFLPVFSMEEEKMKIKIIPEEFPRTAAGKVVSVMLTVLADKDDDDDDYTVELEPISDTDYYMDYSDQSDSASSDDSSDDQEVKEVELLPLWRNSSAPFVFHLLVDQPSVVSLSAHTLEMTVTELHTALALGRLVNKSVEIKSQFFGYYYLDIELSRHGQHYDDVIQDYQLIFTRTEDPVVNTLLIVVTVSVMVVTVIIGCVLDIDAIKGVFWHPIGPAVGFFSQFLFMPLVSYGIGYALLPHHLHRLGLFALGTSPGGVYSNLWAVLFDADVNLSITMTYISTLAALGMMPLWLFTLGRQIFPDEDLGEITIPYVDLIISIIGMTVPLAIGVLIQSKRKKLSEFLKSTVMKPLIYSLTLFIIVVHLYNLHHVFFLFSWRLFVCGCVVVGGGYIFGAGLSYACGLNRGQIIAVTLETSLQNASIALVLLKLSLPEPENDVAILACASQLLVTGPPLFISYALMLIYRKIRTLQNNSKHKKETSKELCEVSKMSATEPQQAQLVAVGTGAQPESVEQEAQLVTVEAGDAAIPDLHDDAALQLQEESNKSSIK